MGYEGKMSSPNSDQFLNFDNLQKNWIKPCCSQDYHYRTIYLATAELNSKAKANRVKEEINIIWIDHNIETNNPIKKLRSITVYCACTYLLKMDSCITQGRKVMTGSITPLVFYSPFYSHSTAMDSHSIVYLARETAPGTSMVWYKIR